MNTQDNQNNQDTQKDPLGFWVGFGLAIGAGIGVAIDNRSLGIAIGFLMGTVIAALKSKKSKSE